jgi:hypothetical protein
MLRNLLSALMGRRGLFGPQALREILKLIVSSPAEQMCRRKLPVNRDSQKENVLAQSSP